MKGVRVAGWLAFLVLAGMVAGFTLAWRPAIAPVQAAARSFDPAVVAQGAQLAAVGDCAVCHVGTGPGVDGRPYAGGRPVQTPFGAVYATNITRDLDTGIGTWSEAAFVRAMRDGVDRAGNFLYPAFPYTHYTRVSDADLSALYAFLMTREAVRADAPHTRLPFPLNVRPLMAGWNLLFLDHGPAPQDPARGAEWNRGAYLVEGLGHCSACHSPRNALGAERKEAAYTGGEADGWQAPGLTAASSPAAIAWSADALFRYLRHGEEDRHGAAGGPMRAVSHNLAALRESDVRAIAAFVASMTDPAGRAAREPDRESLAMDRAAAAYASPRALRGTEGATIFAGACAGCHGAGAPMVLDGRPSLALGSSVTADGPRNAAQMVLYGLQPLPGQRGPWMPGFADTLTDPQVAAVLGYLRARFTDRPAWTDVAARVTRIRQEAGR